MPTKAVQQFMLGTVLGNENQARETLAAMKAAGYNIYAIYAITGLSMRRLSHESLATSTVRSSRSFPM